MDIAALMTSFRLGLYQLGLAPGLLSGARLRAHAARSVQEQQAARRWRGRFKLLAAAAAMVGAAAIFAPPGHGAMLVVLPPWIDTAEAERRILEAGGVPLSAEDGDLQIFGVRIARIAIGADREFASTAFDHGAFILDAGPILWIDDKMSRVAAWFGRGQPL